MKYIGNRFTNGANGNQIYIDEGSYYPNTYKWQSPPRPYDWNITPDIQHPYQMVFQQHQSGFWYDAANNQWCSRTDGDTITIYTTEEDYLKAMLEHIIGVMGLENTHQAIYKIAADE